MSIFAGTLILRATAILPEGVSFPPCEFAAFIDLHNIVWVIREPAEVVERKARKLV